MTRTLAAIALAVVLAAPAAAQTSAPAPPRAKAKAAGKPAAKPVAAANTRRPLMLGTQNIEGRADAPRVLFVHTGPKIALEDAPKHPSYLRDDFTAALASPVRIHVRTLEPLPSSAAAGGNR